MDTVKTVKVACEKTEGNDKGYYLCNEDSVPKGAKVLKETKKAAAETAEEKAPAKAAETKK